jgi:23S rRNA (cytidine1920-2'-O)/16S rRNA (cytidine1409-2'-O)-methyltransferase
MSLSSSKKRLDLLVHERHPHITRSQAVSFIMQGCVSVDSVVMTKSGALVSESAAIVVRIDKAPYVSRAGAKLSAALDYFKLDVADKVALDAGISTGGFSDCLLQRGIGRIYGVDVGYGLVHEAIRTNPRLVLMERTNLRYLERLPELVDLVTLDLSFISVLKVIDPVKRLMKSGGDVIVLIKPQFEAGRAQVGRGGVVTDPMVHQSVVELLRDAISAQGFLYRGCISSPILGGSGNKEFLAYFVKQ